METNNNPKSEQTIKSQERTVRPSNQYIVDPGLSVINWNGSKPAGKHNGKIKVKSGEIIFKGDNIVSGKFTADMTTLTVLDLSGSEKTDLENHLKGNIEGKEDHFFDVNQYPEADFKITSSEKRDNTYSIYGDLIIKGKSNAIKFIANIDFSKDLKLMKMTTESFEIDRTKWGIEYMSRSVFDDLKERFIYDEIGLQVILKATKKS